jgi:1-acyl-sn-glycerol-3-phosphate acyltransferase
VPEPGRIDPAVIATYLRWWAPLVRRMWPATLHGLEHLPEGGKFLIVANHSGMGIAEVWSLILAWWEQFGHGRPLAGMAHPGAFHVPPVRWFVHGLGGVPATREGAALAVRAGCPMLLFPGGDHEATRPFWKPTQVDFAGRKGWIALAREHGLSVVPLAITGSHNTLPILAGGRALSWMIGMRALGAHRAPLTVLSAAAAASSMAVSRLAGASWLRASAIAWASVWATSALPWLPARIGFRFLSPISASELADPSRDDAMYARVVGALQRAVEGGLAGAG